MVSYDLSPTLTEHMQLQTLSSASLITFISVSFPFTPIQPLGKLPLPGTVLAPGMEVYVSASHHNLLNPYIFFSLHFFNTLSVCFTDFGQTSYFLTFNLSSIHQLAQTSVSFFFRFVWKP